MTLFFVSEMDLLSVSCHPAGSDCLLYTAVNAAVRQKIDWDISLRENLVVFSSKTLVCWWLPYSHPLTNDVIDNPVTVFILFLRVFFYQYCSFDHYQLHCESLVGH